MTLTELVEQIWQLPWYKVLAIAIVDDFILMLKIWWIIAPFFIGYAVYLFWVFKKKS